MKWLDRLWRHLARQQICEVRPQLCHVRYLWVNQDSIRQTIETAPRQIAQYEAFSAVWPQFAADFEPNYLPYIAFLARRHRLGCDLALDLACGSGRMTEQLLRRFGHVHCLDRSPAMLQRLRGDLSMIRGRFTVHQADFRAFTLPVTVPFVVCAGDSLNYVEGTDQLAAVFTGVAACLREGGFFLFDVITAAAAPMPPGYALVAELSGHIGGPFRLCTWYGADGRTEYSYMLSPDGVEDHRRRLITLEDIGAAAEVAGLVFEDRFPRDDRLYCILCKPPGSRSSVVPGTAGCARQA